MNMFIRNTLLKIDFLVLLFPEKGDVCFLDITDLSLKEHSFLKIYSLPTLLVPSNIQKLIVVLIGVDGKKNIQIRLLISQDNFPFFKRVSHSCSLMFSHLYSGIKLTVGQCVLSSMFNSMTFCVTSMCCFVVNILNYTLDTSPLVEFIEEVIATSIELI